MRIIAGPCVHENFELSKQIAEHCQNICDKYNTGELVHKQPFSRDPKLSDGTYRDFVYTWKLYHTEWTDSIDSGTYQIIVGGDFEPHSENGKVNILIDL